MRMLLLLLASCALAQQEDYAQRIACELDRPTGASLPMLHFLQGATPLLELQITRAGRRVQYDPSTTARFVLGPDATGLYFVAVSAYLQTNGSHYVQLPTLGTNTGTTSWWYTVLLERDGRAYWAGAGRARIEATSATSEDGVQWQDVTTSGAVRRHNEDADAHPDIRALIAANTNEVDPVWSAHAGGVLEHVESPHGVADGGFVGGLNAGVSAGGGAVGQWAFADSGGAVGQLAHALGGGAVGRETLTGSGFAGGLGAMTMIDWEPIDAIQLGGGTNSEPRTLQVYDYRLVDAAGHVPVERVPYSLTGVVVGATRAAVTSSIAYLPSPTLGSVLESGPDASTASGRVAIWVATNQVVTPLVRGPSGGGDVLLRDNYVCAGAGLYYVGGSGGQHLGLDGSRWGTVWARGLNLSARNAGSAVPTVTNFISTTVATNADWVPTCSAVRGYLQGGAAVIVLPTSSHGLPSGAIWADSGTVRVVP